MALKLTHLLENLGPFLDTSLFKVFLPHESSKQFSDAIFQEQTNPPPLQDGPGLKSVPLQGSCICPVSLQTVLTEHSG